MIETSPALGGSAPGVFSPATWIDRLLQCGVLGLLLFGPLAFGAVEPWSMLILQAGAAWLFALWVFQQMSHGFAELRWNPVFAPMAAFALLVLLQLAAHRSAYRYATVAAALLFCAYGLLCFLATQVLRRQSDLTGLGLLLSAYGFLISVFAVAQSLTSNGKLYWLRTPRFGGWIFGPYVNHNHYAGLMELLVPVPLAICLSRRVQRGPKVLLGFVTVFMASTVFLSGSRAGMAAIGVQVALLVLFLALSKRTPRTAIVLAGCLAAAALWVTWLGGSSLADRIATLHSEAGTELSSGLRLAVTRDCLHMFVARPLLGWGLGTFPTVYPGFQSFFTDAFINEAHNDYAQLLVEMGATGFVAMLWFLLMVVRGAWRKIRGNNLGVNGCAALAGALGCAGILVHSFFDFNLQVPANAALFYVIAVITAAIPISEHHRHNRSARL